MGAVNLRRSLSPLHTEVETLVWAMKCMTCAEKRDVAFITDCSNLVKRGHPFPNGQPSQLNIEI